MRSLTSADGVLANSARSPPAADSPRSRSPLDAASRALNSLASNLSISAATTPAAAGSTRFARFSTATASASASAHTAAQAGPAGSAARAVQAASASTGAAGLRRASQTRMDPPSAGAAYRRRTGDHAPVMPHAHGGFASISVAVPAATASDWWRPFPTRANSVRSSGDHVSERKRSPQFRTCHDRTVRPVERSATRTPNESVSNVRSGSPAPPVATSDPSAVHATAFNVVGRSSGSNFGPGVRSADRNTAGPETSTNRPSGENATPGNWPPVSTGVTLQPSRFRPVAGS